MDVIVVDERQQQTSGRHRVSLTTPQTYLHPSLASSPRILHPHFGRVPRTKGNETLNRERARQKKKKRVR
ncbi:Uncharacterized protein HZ326_31846 [Fusarium oxysporum f. sp. albedinis]|nr:Uncharacterized protein HZ326_31846 [Fusarium oxysporum f. sp. albedinis]